MKSSSIHYACPITRESLAFEGSVNECGDLADGFLVSKSGQNRYPVVDSLPNFVVSRELALSDRESLAWYRDNAATYDEYLPLTFMTFDCDEDNERSRIIELLRIEPEHRILETGCGTGRDSERIASSLSQDGELYLQDISEDVLRIVIKKLSRRSFSPKVEFAMANAYQLPFLDGFFDRAFHFGGLNTFGNIRQAFREMVRVTKPGGRIVVGDENMPVWLRDTEFGRILMNSNAHYRFDLPLEHLPIEARNVKIEWFIGGVFYLISFDVGIGEPYANLDFEIPGRRGGTHRTRYYGQIEGVRPDTKRLAIEASMKSGKSVHQWLDEAIRRAALQEETE